jgi:hypothetical protein
MTDGNSPGVKPTVEDKQRLDILSKEIDERLEEFGNIILKTLAIKTDSKVTFEKKSDGGNVIVVEPGPVVILGRYCDPPGMCCPGPGPCPC